MKLALRYFVAIALLLPAAAPLRAEPAAVLSVLERVADWELAHPPTNHPTSWVGAVGDAGVMALAGISGNAKYREAMRRMGETNHWELLGGKGHMYDADDQCIGQTYAELYNIYREPQMIAPLRERLDYVLAHPAAPTNLNFTQLPRGSARERWSWCDSLFMAPPAWLRLSAATGDSRYLDYALTNLWFTTAYLYDTHQHLYYRDSTYFGKREANFRNVFWSRGNGWVLAGLARTLQYLPTTHPDYLIVVRLFQQMARAIVAVQQPDGLWRSSLLDPDSYPAPETSGTGLFTYGLAWGLNQGFLDRPTFEPAVRRAWAALTNCVEADGKLIHVQPVGSDPKSFPPESTDHFGVGAFLLAGSEVYRMDVLAQAKPVRITVTNPADFPRESETVEVKFSGHPAVLDGVAARVIPSQIYAAEPGTAPDTLVFQVDLAPGEIRTYEVIDVTNLAAVPPALVKTFARYVPERADDFAWESDRIAHRTYGQALIKTEGTISSGPDVWIKKNRGLIVDMMYRTGHYHQDNGEEMDDYRVGKSRGCGGLGIWDGQKLYVSSNWRNERLITTGPVRSEFELTYDAWDVGHGRQVTETRRISIDAGSWFSKMHTVLTSADPSPLTIGVGLAERACGPDGTELIAQDQAAGWLSYFQPEDRPKGCTAVAIVLPRGSVTAFTNDNPGLAEELIHARVPQPTHEGAPAIRNLLAITQVTPGQPFEYYFGASWDRSGDFTNHEQWEAYVKRVAERRDQPLQVTVDR